MRVIEVAGVAVAGGSALGCGDLGHVRVGWRVGVERAGGRS